MKPMTIKEIENEMSELLDAAHEGQFTSGIETDIVNERYRELGKELQRLKDQAQKT